VKLAVLYYRVRAMTGREVAQRAGQCLKDTLRRSFSDPEAGWKGNAEALAPLLERPPVEEPAPAEALAWSGTRELLERAGAALEGRLVIFGREVETGPAPDWLADPFRRRRTGGSGAGLVGIGLQDSLPADIRSIWELNRLQILVELGRAYRATGQARYAARARELVETWTEANPFCLTVNWTNALEVSLRSLSLLVCLSLIRDCREVLDGRFLQKYSRLLYLHGKYVCGHLSTGSTDFNHLAGEAAGLIALGCLLPGLPGAERWRKRGRQTMERSLLRLILPDGGPLEGSLHYLAVVCRLAVVACRLTEGSGGFILSAAARQRLAAAYHFLCTVTDRGRSISEFGDSDDASAPGPPPSGARERYLGTLDLLYLFLERQPLEHEFKPGQDSLWLFAGQSAGRPERESAADRPSLIERFDRSGHYTVHREAGDGMGQGRSELFLRIECGHWGAGPTFAHAHADRLSFSLFLHGLPFLVDPGTGAYLADIRLREYFRSSRAHNTLVPAGCSQSEPLAAFLWRGSAVSRLETLREDRGRVEFAGSVSLRSSEEQRLAVATHRRRMILSPWEGRLEIEDSIQPEDPVGIEIYFTFHPDCALENPGAGRPLTLINSGRNLVLRPDPRCALSFHRGEENPLRGWYSPGFMRREPCWQIICRASSAEGGAFRTVLEWDPADPGSD
jgi:hypothetical protein